MDNSSHYLFLGGLFPKETEEEIVKNSIGAIQNAANAFQWNIVNGFDQLLNKPIKILNSLYIGSYPKKYRKLFVPTYKFQHIENAEDVNVGFCNLFGYKNFSRKNTLSGALKKWMKNTPGKKYVFAYAMTTVMLSALEKAKKLDPSVVTCLFVPDLPEYMNMNNNSFLYRVLKKQDMYHQKKKLKYVDMFVFLTAQMNEKIGATNYLVVEGIANDSFKTLNAENVVEKTVLYTGGLFEKYGVKNLIDAFMKIQDPEYKLILCGAGDLEPYIQEMQRKDSRIDYRGTVMHSEILKLQMQSAVLVNPRQNTEEFTKYSFPSKNMEYLASGTPVIAYKLDGIPDDYDEYIHYVSDNSVQSLMEKIVEVCSASKEQRRIWGEKARAFILEQKSSKKQMQRLLDFIEDRFC